jgi:uncharacterized protein YuzE
MTKFNSFNVTYDEDSDVLYISTQKMPSARGVEDEYGIVWRYDSGGELIGVTVVDFRDQWFSKRPELAAEISKRFGVPSAQMKIVIDHAFDEGRH